MKQLKRFLRTHRDTVRQRRAEFVRKLLRRSFPDSSTEAAAESSATGLLLCLYAIYAIKRLIQELISGTHPRSVRELSDWHRIKFSELFHKLIRWQENPPPFDPYPKYRENNRLRRQEAVHMARAGEQFEHQPLFSIVVPVFDAKEHWIERLVDSVLMQTYDRWELLLVDDGSSLPETHLALLAAEGLDERITIERLPQNRGVVYASNRAAELAHGEFLAFLDHDDELTRDALWYVAHRINQRSGADVLYSDEELVTEDGHAYPTFKPGFSPEHLTAYNYICHLLVVRKDLFERVGQFRPGTEGAQDYDLVLRLLASTDHFEHIPRVLYRWHIVSSSMSRRVTADGELQRDRDLDSITGEVVQTHLDRYGIPAKATVVDGWVRPELRAVDQGKVSIIICTRDQPLLLWRAVRSILRKTEYPNYEIVIVDNGSRKLATHWMHRWLSRTCRVLSLSNGPSGFNWSALNNQAARQTDGEYLLFLNDDIRVLSRQWLSALVGYHRFPGVGATGARLLFPNRRNQHAGLIVGAMGWGPWHALRDIKGDPKIHGGYLHFPHNCLAVTGACLLTRRSVFEMLGGFNEKDFAVSFNDVDYCLRLAEAGLRTAYVPQAELIHYEGASRGKLIRPQEAAALRRARPAVADPYWNPNFTRESSNFAIRTRRRARGIAVKRPPSALVIGPRTFDLNAGPPWQHLFDTLARRGDCTFVAQTFDGLSEQELVGRVMERLGSERFDLLFAQGVDGTPAIELAHRRGMPAIWHLPDQPLLPPGFSKVSAACYLRTLRALAHPYQVVFNNPHTAAWTMQGQPRTNFSVIENVPLAERHPLPHAKEWLRDTWDVPVDNVVLLSVGRPQQNSGWEAMIAAYRRLPILQREQTSLVLLGQGSVDFDYVRRLRHQLKRNGENVIILVNPPDCDGYFDAADLFVTQETVSLRSTAVLRALEAGLPIIGTDLLVRSEAIHPGVTGVTYRPYDASDLHRVQRRLLPRASLRRRMGQASADWLRSRSDAEVVLKEWSELLRECAELAPAQRDTWIEKERQTEALAEEILVEVA